MFKVGDKVAVRRNPSLKGVVVFVDGGNSGEEVLVKIKGFGGHNGNSFCDGKDYKGDTVRDKWWYYESNLTLVEASTIKIKSDAPWTSITWENGELTLVKCAESDKFDANFGIALATLKYHLGNTQEASILAYDILTKVGKQEDKLKSFSVGKLCVAYNTQAELTKLLVFLENKRFLWRSGQKPTEYTPFYVPGVVSADDDTSRLSHGRVNYSGIPCISVDELVGA